MRSFTFQAVVVFVEDLLGLVDVVAVRGDSAQGRREDPVDVVAHDRGFGATSATSS